MRDRLEIIKDGSVKDLLIIEVLLDIRDLLRPKEEVAPLYVSDKPPKKKKVRRKGNGTASI